MQQRYEPEFVTVPYLSLNALSGCGEGVTIHKG